VRFPCVHAAATTPVQQMGVVLAQNHPSVSAFPDSTFGSACTSTFSRFAQRLLALRPAHSRSHQSRDRYPGASDISSPPCLPRLLPAGAGRRAGLAPAGKAPPCHGARGKPPFGPESSLKSRLAFTQRRVASVPGFGYSKATRKAGAAGLVWGEATLDKFLENPSVFCRAPAWATPASRVPKSAHT
jgi:hypothetical protein